MAKYVPFALLIIGLLFLVFFGCSASQREQAVQIQEKTDVKLPREIIGKDDASMALIPAGEFWMGSNAGSYDEKPRHKVYLGAFYMDKYEVTNAQYRRFVQETGHREPEGWRHVEIKRNHSGYRKFKPWSDDNLNGDNQPVVCVDWADAKAYAEWAGKRLPTEAEWEKAARGGLMGRKYPWGDYDGRFVHDYVNWAVSPLVQGRGWAVSPLAQSRNKEYTTSRDKWEYTAPVGSFPPNKYGLYDMGGNVSEWCADWYDSGYYAKSPRRNPAGPHRSWIRRVLQRSRHVRRGASWSMQYSPPPDPQYLGKVMGFPWVSYLRVAKRNPSYVRVPYEDLGFRCVISANSVSYDLTEDNTDILNSGTKNKPKLMVHYMPWYASRPVSSNWGWHWTMNRFDPEKTDETGRREISSHYYPLIGPYDSSDPAALEYHILLMKLAGIDGIIIDWYGIEDFYDYASLNRNTSHIIEFARKAGLEFAICYEDQTVKHMVNRNYISEDDSIKHARKDMKYLQDKWFSDRLYLKLDDRPVLLVFGPQYFMKSSQWDSIFSVLSIRPQFFTQDNRLSPSVAGAFPWPPMWKSQDGALSWESCNDYLDQFYEKAASWPFVVGAAFPGFHDVYEEAGGRKSYGYLDAQEGKTFADTLEKAIANHTDIIQIVTWNDFGEGTNIEPTEEYGYRYLETIQDLRRKYIDSCFSYGSGDLALCKQLYDLRRKYGDHEEIISELDEVSALLLSGELSNAKRLVSIITSKRERSTQ